MSDSGNGSTSDEFTVILEGGRPWGFTLHGGADFRSPLKIGKVTVDGKAHKSGLVTGDILTNINGIPAAHLKHHEAQRLIASSKSTLELICTKSISATFSPKSVTQDFRFDFPEVVDSSEKSKTLGHVRQRSLDFNFRPRTTSDVGKRATVGTTIAGITVPPPPMKKTRKLSEPDKGEMELNKEKVEEMKIVAGIKVPRAPPKVAPKIVKGASVESNVTDNIIQPALNETENVITNEPKPIINETITSPVPAEPNVVMYQVDLTNFHEIPASSPSSETKTDNTVLPLDNYSKDIVVDEVVLKDEKSTEVVTNIEVGTNDSNVVSAVKNDDTPSDDVIVDAEVTTTGSTSPEALATPVKGDDWYRMMFQSMKKGVEDDLPNKKPVWDRSPVPARKSEYEFESKVSPNYKYKNVSYISPTSSSSIPKQRRYSESSLPSPTHLNNPMKVSSSGSNIGMGYKKADVVSEISTGVVYQKSTKKYNQSRNYWKSIERQASQERIELAAAEAKRNSLRRTSSTSSTGLQLSPNDLTTVTDENKPDQPPSAFFKEEVISTFSAYQSSIAEEDSKDILSVSPVAAEKTIETMSHLHPLLKGGLATEDDNTTTDDKPQQDVFTRIDAKKLNSAIGNASVLGSLKQDGVDALTLQAAAVSLGKSQPEPEKVPSKKKKSKATKSPPGEKAKVSFDFVAASEKELSLDKDTIVNLTEQIDENWLKGEYDGKTGIFPLSFVKVLSPEEVVVLDTTGNDPTELNQLGRALHDFVATNESRELSLTKGDLVTIVNAVDDNWFKVTMGDSSGIVPKSYVEIVQIDSDLN